MTKRLYFWLALLGLFLMFLFLIRSILLPFVLGIFTAYFLDPAADKLEKAGCSRAASTMIITGCFFTVITLLALLVVPVLAGQVSSLVTALPSYIAETEQKLAPLLNRWLGSAPHVNPERIQTTLSDFSGYLLGMLGGILSGMFQSGMAFVNFISLILITPVVAYYLLEDWDRITARVDSLLPRQHAAIIRTQLDIIDRRLAGFIRGQLNVCLILALYYTLFLSLAGLHFSVIIGIMTGFLVIVPYAGWALGTSIGMAVAFFQFEDMSRIGAVAGVFLFAQVLEGNFLTPKLVGKRIGVHPVWIIFGMLSGAALFGFVGVLLAVPACAVIGVLLRFAIDRYLQSEFYRGGSAAGR